MGLIAKEKNLGTMEVVSTLPIKEHEFVIGKYLAVLTLLKVALLLTGIMFINLMFVGTNIDCRKHLVEDDYMALPKYSLAIGCSFSACSRNNSLH